MSRRIGHRSTHSPVILGRRINPSPERPDLYAGPTCPCQGQREGAWPLLPVNAISRLWDNRWHRHSTRGEGWLRSHILPDQHVAIGFGPKVMSDSISDQNSARTRRSSTAILAFGMIITVPLKADLLETLRTQPSKITLRERCRPEGDNGHERRTGRTSRRKRIAGHGCDRRRVN